MTPPRERVHGGPSWIPSWFTNCTATWLKPPACWKPTKKAFADSLTAAPGTAPPLQISKEGYLMEGWKTTAKPMHHRHVSHLYGLHPRQPDQSHENPPPLPKPAVPPQPPRRRRHRMEPRMEDQLLGPFGRWRPCLQAVPQSAGARLHPREPEETRQRHLPQPVLLAPALPDGWQPGRHLRHQWNAGAKPRRFYQPAPRPSPSWSEGSLQGFKVRGGATVSLTWNDNRVTTATCKPTKPTPISWRSLPARKPWR